jgi:hypothetical protein
LITQENTRVAAAVHGRRVLGRPDRMRGAVDRDGGGAQVSHIDWSSVQCVYNLSESQT